MAKVLNPTGMTRDHTAMSEGFQILDIILLAMIAGFIALRLRSVLGRRTGHERPPSEQTQARYGGAESKSAPADAPPIDAPAADYRLILKPGSAAADGVDAIARRDGAFDLDSFVQGARGAYELILDGFWRGDREAFRAFVSDDIFNQFDAAIAAREADGETVKNTLDRVRSVEVVSADIRASSSGDMASIAVRFTADVVVMTLDRDGRVVSGNPVDKVEVKDVWTFERRLDSADPNWTLVATRSED